MSEQQLQEAQQHVLNAMVITEHLVKIFKKPEDEQEACILMDALDILPTLKSNLGNAHEIINS